MVRTSITTRAYEAFASVNHAIGRHVVGAVHTNTIEGFWCILKRGVVRTFHKVTNADVFGTAIKGC
jgi:hypothetical protein